MPWFPPWIYQLLRKLLCWLTCGQYEPPKYEPDRWNYPYTAGYDYGHQSANNCYNYGCNKATDTYAQPGEAAGIFNDIMECPAVTAGAVADGLVPRPDGAQSTDRCSHTVALVMDPGQDYHWYRLDDNGMWSHKPGGTEARSWDESGNPITDPQTADRGSYTIFCGYFTVNRCKVKIT
jgi:hypothetical protein